MPVRTESSRWKIISGPAQEVAEQRLVRGTDEVFKAGNKGNDLYLPAARKQPSDQEIVRMEGGAI